MRKPTFYFAAYSRSKHAKVDQLVKRLRRKAGRDIRRRQRDDWNPCIQLD